LLTSLASRPLEHPGTEELLRGLVRVLNAGANDATLADNLNRLSQLLTKADYPTRAALLVGYAERGASHLRSAGNAELSATLSEAAHVATDASAAPDARARAATLLGIAGDSGSEKTLLGLISPEQVSDVAVAAARGLAQPHHAAAVAQMLTADRWKSYPPTLRGAILAAIVGRPELAKPLIDALESKAVPLGAINPTQRDWLKKLPDNTLKARAEKLLAGGGVDSDRNKTYEETRAAVMPLKPVPIHGQKVFRDNCVSCHRLDREGVAVGPDLLDIRNLPKETILLHIVIPELEIAPNFTCYNCTTKDGRTIVGIMISDTPSAVTLRQALAVDETIPRDQIQTLEASKLSLMPQGLEKAIAPQDMADLLAYLRGE
jgi:putative heme-binding domain-containing protein